MTQAKLVTTRKKSATSSTPPIDVLISITSPDSEFSPGQNVSHTKYGEGKIISVHNDKLIIEFLSAGKKEISTGMPSTSDEL